MGFSLGDLLQGQFFALKFILRGRMDQILNTFIGCNIDSISATSQRVIFLLMWACNSWIRNRWRSLRRMLHILIFSGAQVSWRITMIETMLYASWIRIFFSTSLTYIIFFIIFLAALRWVLEHHFSRLGETPCLMGYILTIL